MALYILLQTAAKSCVCSSLKLCEIAFVKLTVIGSYDCVITDVCNYTSNPQCFSFSATVQECRKLN